MIVKGYLLDVEYDTVSHNLTFKFAASEVPEGLPPEALERQANGNLYEHVGVLTATVNITNPNITNPYVTWINPDMNHWRCDWAAGAWGTPYQIPVGG